MKRYSEDHKFSEKISKCFQELRLHEFVNPISSYPWGGRNRIIGRIRVFEKYLKPEDVVYALWHHKQCAKTMSKQDLFTYEPGLQYLNKLMDERSNGQYWAEMEQIARSLPSVMEYADEFVNQAKRQRPGLRLRPVLKLVYSAPQA